MIKMNTKNLRVLTLLVVLVTAIILISCCVPEKPSIRSRIAFISGRDGNDEIYVMNSDGSQQTRLTNNPARDWWPNWFSRWQANCFQLLS